MAESTSTVIVRARSAAEIPVETPSRASTVTEYAVPLRSSLIAVIGGSSSRSRPSASIGTQMTPTVWRTMKPTSSGVALAAAKMRSPSFSRSSSSTTTTGRPAAIAAIAPLDRVEDVRPCSGQGCDGVRGHERSPSSFSTYLAMTSTSRLTGRARACGPSVVSSRVVGMRLTVNQSWPTSTTVSETPSTVIEPFSTT